MLSKGSPYRLSDSFADMSTMDVDLDVERFFIKYTVDKRIDGIEPKDIEKVFFLYISQYLVHKDCFFDYNMN